MLDMAQSVGYNRHVDHSESAEACSLWRISRFLSFFVGLFVSLLQLDFIAWAILTRL